MTHDSVATGERVNFDWHGAVPGNAIAYNVRDVLGGVKMNAGRMKESDGMTEKNIAVGIERTIGWLWLDGTAIGVVSVLVLLAAGIAACETGQALYFVGGLVGAITLHGLGCALKALAGIWGALERMADKEGK